MSKLSRVKLKNPSPHQQMKFPHPINIDTAFDHHWFNQITEYVLELEKRIKDLERLQAGESIDGSLSESPWISSDSN